MEANKFNGLYLGAFSYTDKKTNAKKYVTKALIWSDCKNDSLIEPAVISIYTDTPLGVGQKVFAKCEVSYDLVKDFKSGFFKPKYTDLTFKN